MDSANSEHTDTVAEPVTTSDDRMKLGTTYLFPCVDDLGRQTKMTLRLMPTMAHLHAPIGNVNLTRKYMLELADALTTMAAHVIDLPEYPEYRQQ